MSAIDFAIVVLIAAAFAAVVIRVRKKGLCADCSNAGACGGSCKGCGPSARAKCPACEGLERTVEKLGGNIDKS